MTDNQQRAAAVIPNAMRLYYPDVLDEVAAALDEAEQRGRTELADELETLARNWERTAHRAEQDGETVAAAVHRHLAGQLRAFLADVTP